MSAQEVSFRAFVNRIGKLRFAKVASVTKASLYVFLLIYPLTILVWLILRWVGRMTEKPSPGAGQIARYAILAVAVVWGVIRRKEVFAYFEDLFATLKRAPLWVLCYFATLFGFAWLVTAYMPWWVWFGYFYAAIIFTVSMVMLHDKSMELENEASKRNHVRIAAMARKGTELTLFESVNVTDLHVEPSDDLSYNENGVALGASSVEYDCKRYAVYFIQFTDGVCTINLEEQA